MKAPIISFFNSSKRVFPLYGNDFDTFLPFSFVFCMIYTTFAEKSKE